MTAEHRLNRSALVGMVASGRGCTARPVNLLFGGYEDDPMLLPLVLAILSLPLQGSHRLSFDLDDLPPERVRIPSTAERNLRQIVRVKCGKEVESSYGRTRDWFDAMPIRLGSGRKALLVWASQHKECLSGANNRWIWILLQKGPRYETVLSDTTLRLTLLAKKSYGLRDIRTDAYTAPAQYTNIFRFTGKRYIGKACWYDEFVTPTITKRRRIPCRSG